jgi:dethiobiotin synthetase
MKQILRHGAIITGTDTNVGKTLCAIHCLRQTEGTYWKPIQAGRPRDRDNVQTMTGLDDSHFLKEIYD